jgi:hypothetical protein
MAYEGRYYEWLCDISLGSFWLHGTWAGSNYRRFFRHLNIDVTLQVELRQER